MKNRTYILAVIILLIWKVTPAQDKLQDKTNSKFSLFAQGGIGYATIENNNQPNYNLNSNSGDLLINYHVDEKFGFATGIGLSELSGNGFNAIGSFFHERTLLKIPLLVSFTSKFSDSFTIYANLGVYGQNTIEDKYRFLNNSQKNIYHGWNFGLQGGAGFIYSLSKNFGLGFALSGQSDFSEFETNDKVGFDDEQNIKNLISFGTIFQLKI